MHTKGKWQTEFRNEMSEIDGGFRRKVYVTSFDAGEVICRVFGNPDVSVQENNASLIAAAPDLLTACKNAILLIIGERIKNDNLKPDSIIEEHLDVLIRMSENELEKAIEKAEGK